jgi:phage terminase large subunit-like protein
MQNYILDYWNAIQSGQIVTSQKVKKVYEKIASDLSRKDWDFYYDEKRAEHALYFIEHFCKQSKGKDGGQPIKLLLWQKALICTLFGFVDADGFRKYRELFLVVARKCGKTTLASGIGLYMLFADGEHGPSVVSAATTREQAKLSWDEAKKMIKKSPALSKRARCLVGDIITDFNDGNFKPLASDSNTLDGLNPSAAIMDEIAAWTNGKALYDVIIDGESARESPLNIMITTAGTVREDIFDELYDQSAKIIDGYQADDGYHDERFLPLIYELDKRQEWTDESCWIKANPSLDAVKSREALRYKVEKAKQNPMLVKNLLCKDFDVRETTTEAWLPFESVDNRDTFNLDRESKSFVWHHVEPDGTVQDRKLSYPRYGIGGCDMSSTTDLTAAKVIFAVPDAPGVIFALQMYWLPADLIDKRVNEDKIPYDKWAERGLMRTCQGNKVHQQDVKDWFVEIQNDFDIYIPWVGYDSWSAQYWVDDMSNYFGPASMLPVIQGKKTLSAPMKQLGNDLESKLIVYNNNPIDKWCICNTAYEEDKNGNIQPHKTSKPTRRIDGLAALLDAYVVLQDKQQEYLSLI